MVKGFVASVAGKEEEDGQGAEISCPLDAVSPRFTSQLSCYTLFHTRVGTSKAKNVLQIQNWYFKVQMQNCTRVVLLVCRED